MKGARALTPGEIELARSMFGDAIELVGYNLDRAANSIGLTLIWRDPFVRS